VEEHKLLNIFQLYQPPHKLFPDRYHPYTNTIAIIKLFRVYMQVT